MYGIAVVNCNIPPTYFLDEMTDFELSAVLNQFFNALKNGWEQTRYICYFLVNSFSTKTVELSDVMDFKWDKKINKIEKVSQDDIITYQQQLLDVVSKKLNKNQP